MGINYYVKRKQPCECCKRPYGEGPNIGKSSGGWQFLFAPYPEENIYSAKAWWDFLKDKEIVDEDDEPILLTDLQALVEAKRKGWSAFNRPEGAYSNHNPHDYETVDDDGYRISRHPYFS